MEEYDSKSRTRLAIYLSRYHNEILAVYASGTPITKAMQIEVARLGKTTTLSKAAKDFIASLKSPV